MAYYAMVAMYADGHGVRQDFEKAREWFIKAEALEVIGAVR